MKILVISGCEIPVPPIKYGGTQRIAYSFVTLFQNLIGCINTFNRIDDPMISKNFQKSILHPTLNYFNDAKLIITGPIITFFIVLHYQQPINLDHFF